MIASNIQNTNNRYGWYRLLHNESQFNSTTTMTSNNYIGIEKNHILIYGTNRKISEILSIDFNNSKFLSVVKRKCKNIRQ